MHGSAPMEGVSSESRTPRRERREAWGMANVTVSEVVRPRTAADVVAAFELARERGLKVIAWGNGRSYGDAALNEGHLVLDMGEMNRIVAWDKSTGKVTVEPGVTIAKLWRHILPDGYWPPVVSGTSFTTFGGCAAANVHGKNNWKHGPIGEHIESFTLVTPDGTIREVTPDSDPNLFHAAIGGFGALGVFTSITLQTKRVYSGRLDVQPLAAADLDAMFRHFEHFNAEEWDYVVGWIDAFARGRALGRGNMHAARYVERDEDPEGQRMLDVGSQELSSSIFGFPKAWLWWPMRFWAHRPGMRFINWSRYTWSTFERNQHRHLQPHAQFNFLLDFVPNWKKVYEPSGLIQIQLFIPKAHARRVIQQALQLQQDLGYESWLVVMKRHRRDPFWLSHAVDGYSFAMDFPVWPRRRQELLELGRRLERMVVESGGRFYLAKDSLVRGSSFRESLGDEILGHFAGMKARLDPDGLLESNLWRRLSRTLGELPIHHLSDGEVFTVPRQSELLADPVPAPMTPSLPDPQAPGKEAVLNSAIEGAEGSDAGKPVVVEPGAPPARGPATEPPPIPRSFQATLDADDPDIVDDPEVGDDDPEADDRERSQG